MLKAYLLSLFPLLLIAFAFWLFSLWKKDVSIVDSVWSVFFLAAAIGFNFTLPEQGPRAPLILTLVASWAIRLCAHITWRNWGRPEDRRYQAIRQNNEPNFAFKSLYIVFILQALLAWIISLPLLAAMANPGYLQWSDYLGVAVFVFGFAFESIADWQLAVFKSQAQSQSKIMDLGLWRYTRHPNYFGEFCVWWGFYCLGAGAGFWWVIVSPALMSFLLLRVSGVPMLEKDMAERRPAYRDYMARTNAFFPGPPKPRSTPSD